MKTRLVLIIALFCAFAVAARGQGLPSPVPCPQFFSASGVPLSGGFLFTYAAGTLAQQPTYTDSTLSTQNTNPIVLNAGGFPASSTGSCGIFLNPSLTYKFILQNASGSLIWTVDNITVSNITSLLSQPNTWTALQTFAGGIVIPGGTTFNSISAPIVNNVYFIDGNTFAKTAVGINSADSTLGSTAGEIDLNYPGSYCDAVVNVSNGHTLKFGPGLYLMNIAGADSGVANVTWGIVGAGSNQTTIQSCSGSNKDVITSQNFATFTATSNFYGTYHVKIKGVTVDGNKSANAAGFGIRLYGRSPWPEDILTQNAAQDGQWWEWGGTETDSGAGTSVNGQATILESDYNGGNGFSLKGLPTGIGSAGALQSIGTLIGHNNGAWGLLANHSMNAQTINVYENNSGGCDIQGPAGVMNATNAFCDTSTAGTWGLLQETTAGQVTISGGFIGGAGIPMELRSSSGGVINAFIADATAGQPCIKLNGAGSFVINAEFFSCGPPLVQFASEASQNSITGISETTTITPLVTGTPHAGDTVNLTSGSTNYFALPTASLYVTTTGWTPIMPLSNGTLLVTKGVGVGDPHFQYAAVSGCATPGTAGSPCASPMTITWSNPFADNAYFPVCTGGGITSGSPGAVYAITLAAGTMTINYPALTNAAAQYNTVFCWAVHN